MVTRDPSYNPGRVQTNVKNESDVEEDEEEEDYEDDRDSGNERYSSSSRSRTKGPPRPSAEQYRSWEQPIGR